MVDRDPFRVMCEMWGLDIATERAKAFGVEIKQEVVEEYKEKESRLNSTFAEFVKLATEKKERETNE